MISILKITDKSSTDRLIRSYGISYAENDKVLAAVCDGEILEFVLYSESDNSLDIKYISDGKNGYALLDGLIKSLLFAIDAVKTERVTVPCAYGQLVKSLGFTENNDVYTLKPSEYNNTCSGKGRDTK